MQKIFKLDKNLANQISAWEVVERPVSIVKELVENSIDARSSNIKIFLQEWWKKLICVDDDGDWIFYDDLKIILEKYTTSKIKTLNDLYEVMTFGFRWEALSSISSVSKVEILSKTKETIEAYKLNYSQETGQSIWKDFKEQWTKITIKDLFYNTPARLNYLKQDKTEYSKIYTYIQNISLSYPEIWFELINEWKTTLKFNQNEDLKTRIYKIYSDEVLNNLLKVDFQMQWVKVFWYINNPTISFKNKNKQHIFVNKRPINSPLISKAINDAFNSFIPHWNYPFYVLNLQIDPTLVDVNVHPRKQEVRFALEQNVFRVFYHSILNTLEKSSFINNSSVLSNNKDNQIIEEKEEFTKKYYTWSWTKFKSYSPYKDTASNPNQLNIKSNIDFTKTILDSDFSFKSKEFKDDTPQDLHYTKLWKIIWQALNSFIIVEKDMKIFIYDQHALAERVIFQKLSKNFQVNIQKLLIPQTIKLSLEESNLALENIEIFKKIGFDFEILSNNIISILSIPDFVGKENAWEIFSQILQDLLKWNDTSFKVLSDIKNKIISYTACRWAVKFWNKLNLFEINKLLWDAYDTYFQTCPHGRSVVFSMDLNELKNKYDR